MSKVFIFYLSSSSSVSQIKLPSMDNVDGAIIENAQGFEYYDVVAGMKAGESVSSDLIFASSLLSVDEITVSGYPGHNGKKMLSIIEVKLSDGSILIDKAPK